MVFDLRKIANYFAVHVFYSQCQAELWLIWLHFVLTPYIDNIGAIFQGKIQL